MSLAERLQRLPRETRDSLFLLGVIAAVIAPHVGHLPWWSSALAALVLLWRAALAITQRPLPSRWWLFLVFGAAALLARWSFGSFAGREPGITLLVVLMGLKTLELRARRDAFVVFFLGFFLVLTHFFYSQSLLSALWMLLALWGLLAAVVLAQMPSGQPQIAIAARRALHTTLIGLPVMVMLFVFFPRIAPLWGIPSDAVGRTGLSNQLEFGAMNEIANDDSVALRLRFDGPVPPADQRYFRGPVLLQFDGKTWRSPQPSADSWQRGRDDLTALGPALGYEMTLEPLRLGVLPLLEMSPGQPGDRLSVEELTLTRDRELQWTSPRPITERLRLRAEAHARWQAGLNRRSVTQAYNLQLPAGLNPRTRRWAAELAAQPRFAGLDATTRAPALAEAVLAHIRSQDYTYTLSPGRYGEDGPHLIDEFWFDRRLGFCEHFASAFVVVMRAMGVPARVVTGFQGWDAEPQDGYYVVRNANAHAWAEYWVPGRGWQRADPTAAVAPGRVEQGQALRPEPGVFGQLSPGLWRAVRGVWETVDNRWAQWVLNYSRQNQFDLLKGLGFEQPDWTALGQTIAGLILLLALGSAGWIRWSSRPHDAWSRQRAAVQTLLARAGVEAPSHESPQQWAARLRGRHGEAATVGIEWLEALHRARYAAGAAPPDTRDLRRSLRALKAGKA
jgi:transglutaminase-like putative cysteine protease